MSSVVDTPEYECDEKPADVDPWGLNDLAFGGFTEKVWVLSGSPACVTEIVADI